MPPLPDSASNKHLTGFLCLLDVPIQCLTIPTVTTLSAQNISLYLGFELPCLKANIRLPYFNNSKLCSAPLL